jgi:hypothetical protein
MKSCGLGCLKPCAIGVLSRHSVPGSDPLGEPPSSLEF